MNYPRYTLEKTISDCDATKREVPSFIESKLSYPYGFRRLPDDQTKPKRLFVDDSEFSEEPELVQVYLRLKPCNGENALYQVKSDRCLVTSLDTATAGHGRRTQHHVSKLYTFSHIFGPNATQKQIFEHVVKDNLKKLSEGHSFTLLTYGASGSGKTYTLMGTVAAPGLVPRSLEYVFKLVDAAQEPRYKPVDGGAEKLGHSMQELEMKFVKNLRQVSAPLRDKYRRMSARLTKEMSTLDLTNRTQYFVWVSFVEIYNEAVYDLLVSSDRRTTSKLRIREDSTGHVYVKGATQAFVRSGEEAYDVMVAGKHNLQVAATGVHARSSRSHCIFTITLLAQSETSVRVSCVRLCDLAGAERAGRTQNRGARMQESRAINSSLHVLEKCLHALRRNQRAQLDANLVPYRESKLTRLLGRGLSGARGEAVSMVVTINPHPDDMHETKHVLQLANVARDIQVNNTIEETWSEHNSQNSTVCSSAEVMHLRAENERLHFELAQAHAHCKRLVAESEESRHQAAARMTQLVNEAKDITSQFYKSMIANMEERHRSELRELIEEYESKLQAAGISTVTTHVKQKLMSERFSQSSSFIEEDDISERIAELSTQGQNKTFKDDSVSIEANAHRESLLVVSDNYSSDDEVNESLEPNFKIQNDLNLTKQPSNDDSNSPNVDDSLLKDNTIDEESNDNDSISTLDDDMSASNTANVVEDSASFKTAENTCNTTDGMSDSKEQSKTKSDFGNIDTSGSHKVHLNIKTETVNASSNTFTEQMIKIETIKEDDESNTNIESVLQDPNLNPQVFLKKDFKTTSRSSIAYFEACEKKIKAGINASSHVPKPYTMSMNKPHYFFESLSVSNKLTSKNKRYFDEQKSQSEFLIETNNSKSSILNNNAQPKNIKLVCNTEHNPPNIKMTTEVKNSEKLVIQMDNKLLENSSPSIVKDYEMPKNCDSTRIKTLLGETSVLESTPTKNESIDVFDDLNYPVPVTIKKNNAETKRNDDEDQIRKNLANTSLTKNTPELLLEDAQSTIPESLEATNSQENKVSVPVPDQQHVIQHQDTKTNTHETNNSNNTADDFENIYNDLSRTRATEFDLLVSQELSQTNINNAIKCLEASTLYMEDNTISTKHHPCHLEKEKPCNEVNINIEKQESDQKPLEISKEAAIKSLNLDAASNRPQKQDEVQNTPLTSDEKPQSTEVKVEETKSKYNLRNKNNDLDAEDQEFQKIKEIISKPLTRRNLRLRRRKNENIPDITENVESSDNAKLKDIVNLQKEFSDVTMDMPVTHKVTQDIPSPDKGEGDENIAPTDAANTMGKSVTRSRRKLFTPRAEPLEDSPPQTGDSNERIRAPRPSYHRPRARRKL